MSKQNPLHYAMKRAEYAFKRSEFNPGDYASEKYPWFRMDPGQSFFIEECDHKTSSVRAMAHYRSNFSGYEFSMNKTPTGTKVTRVA